MSKTCARHVAGGPQGPPRIIPDTCGTPGLPGVPAGYPRVPRQFCTTAAEAMNIDARSFKLSPSEQELRIATRIVVAGIPAAYATSSSHNGDTVSMCERNTTVSHECYPSFPWDSGVDVHSHRRYVDKSLLDSRRVVCEVAQ
jgi:hypothetical protein